MQELLREKEVVAMYDVRGIQDYIFRTNKIKEIVGASAIVEKIIERGFLEIIEKEKLSLEQYLLQWKTDRAEEYFLNEKIQMQVMFIGGGNAFVLFRSGKLCEHFNRSLAKYVLEQTYSLQLAVAVIERTEDYSRDYAAINERMIEIKASMPAAKPIGAFPFMAIDTVTGFPLTETFEDGYVCRESALKLKNYVKSEAAEDLLDRLIVGKGDSSILAMIHIDGNNIGKRIGRIMQGKTNYVDAIKTMRSISKSLNDSFSETFEKLEQSIDQRSAQVKPGYLGKLYRKVILAGDDMTLICNAMVALDAVRVFLQELSQKTMYCDESLNEEENLRQYALSACAGISYFHSHFPFRTAYEVAEACCASAKKCAKETRHRAGGEAEGSVGSYLDFQICSHIKTMDLEEHREKNYRFAKDGGQMICRPYYVACQGNEMQKDLNRRNARYDLEDVFMKNLRCFQENSRSKMKHLRNAYALGMPEVHKEIAFLKEKQVVLPEANDPATWYDALEMMDFCVLEEENADEAEN